MKAVGDKRCEKSAALVVVDGEKIEVKMKVDTDKDPIEKLIRRLKISIR